MADSNAAAAAAKLLHRAKWNSRVGTAAAAAASTGVGAVAATTPAPPSAASSGSLANWANGNLARRMMLFNKHLVHQATPSISVTENEKFIRWRDNGREFVPVETAPGRPALMRMMMSPTPQSPSAAAVAASMRGGMLPRGGGGGGGGGERSRKL